MRSREERHLASAQRRVQQALGSGLAAHMKALEELREAERRLAATRNEQYAEEIDLGVRWDVGAPLPHVLAGTASTFVVCHAAMPDPNWDGTFARVVSPGDTGDSPLLVIEILRCADIRIGGPNDEALHGHPLYGKGLAGYAAHEVHNSEWIEQRIRINSVHPHHSDERFRTLNHYLLAFHDEMVEALGVGIQARPVQGTIRSVLTELIEQMTN